MFRKGASTTEEMVRKFGIVNEPGEIDWKVYGGELIVVRTGCVTVSAELRGGSSVSRECQVWRIHDGPGLHGLDTQPVSCCK